MNHDTRCLLLACLGALIAGFSSTAAAGYGVVADDKEYIVDTGAGLVFTVLRANGGMPSIKYQGTELNGPQVSGLASGLGSSGTRTKMAVDEQKIVITAETTKDNPVVASLTHYYIVRKNENIIYMATHAEKEPNVGELRWITRLKGSVFPNVPAGSNLRGNTGYIESQDIFGLPDKSSRSKYYGNERALDLGVRGVTGQGVGVFMVYGSRESSAGGPFFRDIQNQTGDTKAEVYNYMNSGHAQTEPLRLGVLQGPYALVFTDGSTPKVPDMTFLGDLGLKGYVGEKQRGAVKIASVAGLDGKHDYLAGFASKSAQYWTHIGDGPALCSGMKPGEYAATIYKGELAVHAFTVRVRAGETTDVPAITIAEDPSETPVLWRIGDWDGTPLEFRNGGNIALMHPSDARQASWQPGAFTVGSSSLSDFPACMWMQVNNGQSVRFTLTQEQIANCELRIGITAGMAGGRPRVKINQWESRLLQGVRQPDSRTFTIGTYRGRNATYRFQVPAKAFVVGENVLTVNVVSGQGAPGFLSPAFTVDCIDLCPLPANAPAVPQRDAPRP